MMKPKFKHNFLFFFLSLFTFSFSAQAQDSLALKQHQFKAGIKAIGLGASYERRLRKSTTFYLEVAIDRLEGTVGYYTFETVDPAKSDYQYSDGYYFYKTDLIFKETNAWVPNLSSEFRKYYNINKRIANKKKTQNNSFDYVGIGARYYFNAKTNIEEVKQPAILAAYATWGIQKVVGKAFSFEFNLGPGIQRSFEQNTTELYVNGNLKFDLVIK